jgi:hypothetical protein
MPWSLKFSGGCILTRQIDLMSLWRAARRHPEMVALALGIFLRLAAYAHGRSYWLDEGSLAGNVVGHRALDFSEPLAGDQLAPFGFLIVVRAVVAILGRSTYVTRLLPLACGLLALVPFTILARRILPRRAAVVAIALFALSDDLIYYSSEFKPYSSDLAIGLAITLLAYGALARPATGRSAAGIALCAVLAPWCSFASVFVVAGCGTSLVLAALMACRYRDAAVYGGIGMAWLLSFVLAYRASLTLLTPYTTMYRFWDFAFLPLWPVPSSPVSLVKAGGILLDVLVNPLNLVPPFLGWVGALLPFSLLAAGNVWLFRRSWPVWLMLVLPVAFAVIASIMKRYPFHGRLILELVPAFFLLIGEGTQAVFEFDRSGMKFGYKAVLVLLLAYPSFSAVYEASAPRPREFDIHGDLHNNLFLFEQLDRPGRPVK